jgi:hypothetical protein
MVVMKIYTLSQWSGMDFVLLFRSFYHSFAYGIILNLSISFFHSFVCGTILNY